MYKNWHDNQEEFTKIVLKTEMATPKRDARLEEPPLG
jgi:hypothetical protein